VLRMHVLIERFTDETTVHSKLTVTRWLARHIHFDYRKLDCCWFLAMQLSGYSFVLKEVLGNIPNNHLNPAFYELKDDGEPLSVCFNRCVPIWIMTCPARTIAEGMQQTPVVLRG
jgi:hypothetical protein